MSVLSTNGIHEAMDTLLDLTSDQRSAVARAWSLNLPVRSTCGLDRKRVALAYAVLDFYSEYTFEELERMAAQRAPLTI